MGEGEGALAFRARKRPNAVRHSLDSRFRGNDGGESGNDGLKSIIRRAKSGMAGATIAHSSPMPPRPYRSTRATPRSLIALRMGDCLPDQWMPR